MTTRLRISAAAAVAALLALAPAAQAQDQPSIHLQPARAEGVVANGQGVGPFTIANLTPDAYSMRVFPVLLGQSRDGGLFVRDDQASLALARRRLGAQVRGFPFGPGAARSVLGRVRHVPAGQGFYGGILFRANPSLATTRRQQLRSILQLNARLILNPRHAVVRWSTGAVRAEQDGRRRLRLLVPVTNRGNTFAWVHALVRVRSATGRVLAMRPARPFRVLPGATVELPVRLSGPVFATGRYRLSAAVRGGGRLLGAFGSMELFGPNEVRTERARLIDFPAPRAYIGDDTKVKASFLNTGNVPYAPPAQIEVRPLIGGHPGPVVARAKLEGDRVAPGRRGEVEGSVKLPPVARSYELTARLLKGGQEADSRANSVTPVKRPPLTARIKDYVTEHAMLIVALLVAGFAIAGAFVGRYIRRLQAAARR